MLLMQMLDIGFRSPVLYLLAFKELHINLLYLIFRFSTSFLYLSFAQILFQCFNHLIVHLNPRYFLCSLHYCWWVILTVSLSLNISLHFRQRTVSNLKSKQFWTQNLVQFLLFINLLRQGHFIQIHCLIDRGLFINWIGCAKALLHHWVL